MSLRISDFYTSDAQNFVFRNACFPILVDMAAHRCLRRFAQAPIFSTLAGLVTCYAIAQGSPLPHQLLSGGIFLAYKATSYALSYFAASPQPKLSWDDVKIQAALRTILPLIESQTDKENLYKIPGKHDSSTSFGSDPGTYTIAEIVRTDVYTLTGFVKALLKTMNPPLLEDIYQNLENASRLENDEKLKELQKAFKALNPPRREIFQMLMLHMNKISKDETSSQAKPAGLRPSFSLLLAHSASPNFISVITYLIQNPSILK